MKRFEFITCVLLAFSSLKAQSFTDWHDIDEATISQHINIDDCKVCVVATITAEPKNDKNVGKQQLAFDELGKIVVDELHKAFPKVSIRLISDAKEAPADALLVEARLDEIDLGSGKLR